MKHRGKVLTAASLLVVWNLFDAWASGRTIYLASLVIYFGLFAATGITLTQTLKVRRDYKEIQNKVVSTALGSTSNCQHITAVEVMSLAIPNFCEAELVAHWCGDCETQLSADWTPTQRLEQALTVNEARIQRLEAELDKTKSKLNQTEFVDEYHIGQRPKEMFWGIP